MTNLTPWEQAIQGLKRIALDPEETPERRKKAYLALKSTRGSGALQSVGTPRLGPNPGYSVDRRDDEL